MERSTNDNVQAFYNESLDLINEIFQEGADDLKHILGNSLGCWYRDIDNLKWWRFGYVI